ncbi:MULTISPECIES: hypothetical protein [Arenibacter]|uniref:hypothetical protein n=1 Tax=Arenibacter TaxID=178469 RepID=UPI0012FFED2D|nr:MULTISPECIES: hypothetical protein [Arenibacter]
MRNIATFTSFILILLACSKDNDLLIPAELDNPSTMIVFCQASPNDTLRIEGYIYDNDNLINKTSIQNGKLQSKTTYDYSSNNQIISEIYETNWKKTEMTYVYNESNQLINILYKFTDYDSDGQVVNESESEAPREYENNQLVREWEYWGGFNTYEYSNGKVVSKIDYTKTGEKHHFTYYKYSGELLIEEKKETKVGGLIYLKTYEYDSENRLSKIKDGDNIIEVNDYVGKKLIEKREYYFGIDPCYAACCGNYIYKYEY